MNKPTTYFYFVVVLLLINLSSSGQYNNSSKLGNYAGTAGVQLNPAKSLSQFQKYSVSVFHFDFGVNNNVKKFSLDSIIAGHDPIAKLPNQNISIAAPIFELGLPSFYFLINKKFSVGFQSRFRLFNQLHNANPTIINYIMNSSQLNNIKAIEDPIGFNYNIHAFMDIGVNGAMNIVDNAQYKINVGAALRYYSGLAYANFYNGGIKGQFQQFGDTLSILNIDNVDLNINTTAQQDINNYFNQFQNINTLKNKLLSFKNPGSGMGIDIGGELIWKNNNVDIDDVTDYKFLIGASITDIGMMRYKDVTQLIVKGKGTVRSDSLSKYNNIIDIKNYLSNKGLTASIDSNVTNKVSLPTLLNLYGDYRISRTLFVGAMAKINMANKKNDNPFYYGSFMIAPRYQTKYIEATLPLTYIPMSQSVKIGLGFRLGPVVIGSDDLGILFTNARGANMFLGIRIDGNINTKSSKNKKQKEGIVTEENNNDDVDYNIEGDSDGDGISDSLDKCPDKKGSREKDGC